MGFIGRSALLLLGFFLSTAKKILRQSLLKQRNSLTPLEQKEAAISVAHRLMQVHEVISAKRLAYYWPVNNELDLRFFIEKLSSFSIQTYLPVLNSTASRHLHFYPYTPGDPLRKNRYGIEEPLIENAKQTEAHDMDVVLVPLVGFDQQCRRLGMGGGFYDTTFSFTRLQKKPFLIGLGYEIQKVERIPTDPWDVLLDKIVSEKAIYG